MPSRSRWLRTPAIPAVALTALTIGMGANIAIFGVVHAVLLGSLPVPDPERLVLLRETNPVRGLESLAVSLPNYLSWKEQARSVDLAAFSGRVRPGPTPNTRSGWRPWLPLPHLPRCSALRFIPAAGSRRMSSVWGSIESRC